MRKWLWIVAGAKPGFQLEHQVFNTTSFFITLFAFMASTSNLLIGLHPLTVWPGYLGGLVSFMIFYLSRCRKVFNSTIIFVYALLVSVFMGWIYFYNDGSYGTINYLIIMFMTILLMITPQKLQGWIFVMMYGSILLLLLLEYAFPAWRVPYRTAGERMADHIITIFLAALFITINVVVFRSSYIEERRLVTRQNEELKALNRQIDVQKLELETLLKELHHRVKNNLQVISSLLALQSNRTEDGMARESLQSSRTRIEAMALIHKSLYQNEDTAAVEMKQYLFSLSSSIATSFGADDRVVCVEDLQEPVVLDIDQAVPLGLIVNELVTNSFKHAFVGTADPLVRIALRLTGAEGFELVVSDNGRWVQEDVAGRQHSFGVKLVGTLAAQLDATVRREHHHGTQFTISRPGGTHA